jgi:oleandomycin transport system ATP-binding protein
VIGELGRRGFGVAGIETRMPSLEEVFLAITGGARSGTPVHQPTDSKQMERV